MGLKDVIEERMERVRGTADVRSSLKLRDYSYVQLRIMLTCCPFAHGISMRVRACALCVVLV
jgi:hypothetical protein